MCSIDIDVNGAARGTRTRHDVVLGINPTGWGIEPSAGQVEGVGEVGVAAVAGTAVAVSNGAVGVVSPSPAPPLSESASPNPLPLALKGSATYGKSSPKSVRVGGVGMGKTTLGKKAYVVLELSENKLCFGDVEDKGDWEDLLLVLALAFVPGCWCGR
jgi:hypothetical protein